MLNRLRTHIHALAASLLAGLSLCACSEEAFEVPDYTVTGADVTLRVPISIPVMDQKSRASLDEIQLNQVENVWVRTYSARTGKATSDWVKQTISTTDTEVPREVTIRTQSGSSYIVAVANVSNHGVTSDNITTQRPLSELLEAANTWADFLKIAVVAPSSQEDVRAPRPPLPMAGCYSDLIVGGDHPEPSRIDEWQQRDFTPYFIPSQSTTVTFEGAIHLRRLVSHINFNFIPGNDNIELTVNSYQVMNAPQYSWLYERGSENGMATNFGDLAQSEEAAAAYYTDVPQYGSQNITTGANGIQQFDFWQSENKHTGDATTYSERDRKTTDGSTLFTSLTGDTWTTNNEASYVVVSCTVDYKNQVKVDGNGNPSATGQDMYRTGEAIYIIHLGYMGDGADADKSKDFNCFRNVNYTYNVTVNGLDDIRLDAFATDEVYHGEEGVVVDLSYATIDIDAHYAVFNVQLTQAELSVTDFGFIITTYDNGQQITLSDDNDQVGSGTSKIIYADKAHTRVIDPKYYNWIELRPTTGANVLAPYKPRYGANADGATFLLTDLKGGWNNMATSWRSSAGYYTVYVNEYTYEPMYTGTEGYANEEWNGQGGRPNWMHYVNQNPRRFYIRVTQTISPDGNSRYARSKYGISQQSLMTYYSDQTFAPAQGDIPAGTAIAVERENENLGLNVRHTFTGGTSTGNGRWNTAQYLNGSATATTNLSINNATATNRPLWTNYVQLTQPMEVPEVAANRLQGGAPIPGRTTANGNPLKIPALVRETNGAAPNFTDPQPSANYTYQAINGCMSRNRDNNGNGRIDPDELRWYVPALNKYIALMLGEAALPEPLMDYASITRLPYVNNNQFSETSGSITNDYCSRYMFVGSNNSASGNVLWGMEGTSVSGYEIITEWTVGKLPINPWQIRCVRNLGSNMTNVTPDDKVSLPYVHNAASRTVRMNYFNLATIRTLRYLGNGTGTGYMPVHTLNTSYNSVYYAFEYAPNDITVPTDYRPTDDSNFFNTYDRLQAYINSNPCGADDIGLSGTGWRVPNQEEVTMMHNIGLLTNANVNATWLSCTVNYFNHRTGMGSDEIPNKYYLIVTTTQATQLTQRNFGDANRQGFFVRCVRDIN